MINEPASWAVIVAAVIAASASIISAWLSHRGNRKVDDVSDQIKLPSNSRTTGHAIEETNNRLSGAIELLVRHVEDAGRHFDRRAPTSKRRGK